MPDLSRVYSSVVYLRGVCTTVNRPVDAPFLGATGQCFSIKKVRIALVFGLALVLTACSSLPKTNDTGLKVGSADEVLDHRQNQQGQATDPDNADLLRRIANGFSLPELNSKHVAEFETWSANHPTYLNNLFNRARPFLYHIVEQIEARGMPMEIALLPAVESAYRPTAVSRSRAVGMWQFIAASGQEYGLEQDWWYDGRRDVLASTAAALDYLTVLHQRFDNDWFLALAAYNGGQGNLARSIRTNENKDLGTDYLALDLRLETRRYVPKLLALRNIVRNPEKYGVSLPSIPNAPAFTHIPLSKQIDLNRLTRALDNTPSLSSKELLNANTGFLRWATPPLDSVAFASNIKGRSHPVGLLIPSVDPAVIEMIKASLSNAPQISFRSHTIGRGDTLGAIARRYGVSVSALREANSLRSNTIGLGKTLVVPVRSLSVTNASSAMNATTLNTHMSSAQTAQGQTTSSVTDWISHRVLKGETLWSIAQRYSVTVSEILNWNKLNVNTPLHLNQSLRLMP